MFASCLPILFLGLVTICVTYADTLADTTRIGWECDSQRFCEEANNYTTRHRDCRIRRVSQQVQRHAVAAHALLHWPLFSGQEIATNSQTLRLLTDVHR